MENLPESLDVTSNEWGTVDISVEQLILALQDKESREEALFVLSKRKSEKLGPLLWHSFGTISILLEEIIATYRHLPFSDRLASISERAVNAIALLRWVVCHSSTKNLFVEALMPCYLYPLLNTTSKEHHYDHLRVMSLGVIGALVEVDDPSIIHFLLQSKFFPCCLRCMEVGGNLSRTVATYIFSKILKQEMGMDYCCTAADRFHALSYMLRMMVEEMVENISLALLQHILVCYLRLSANPRLSAVLQSYIPIRTLTKMCVSVTSFARDQPTALESLQQIIYNINAGLQQQHI